MSQNSVGETPVDPSKKNLESSRSTTIVLLSGGLDSSVNLALAVEKAEVVLALHVDYGQRAAPAEWRASRAIAQYYGIQIEKVELPWLGKLGGSSLTDRSKSIPELRKQELDHLPKIQETARSVWVPNRNGVLLNVAAAYADRLRARRVVVGFNREEATTFPDNSQEFLESANSALAYSTHHPVEVFCYTTQMNKIEMVRVVQSLSRPFPFDQVWSCYHSGQEPCGRCESCGRFERALREGGVR